MICVRAIISLFFIALAKSRYDNNIRQNRLSDNNRQLNRLDDRNDNLKQYNRLGDHNDNVRQLNRLSDHTVVTESNVFPYVAAVLKKQSYLSAGALLDEKWVLTAADALFLVRESARVIRIRLGSVNYKKGGVLLPVRNIEVHPSFDDQRPLFDVALMRLAEDVWFTPHLYPIRMQSTLREVVATHFIVTGWTPKMQARNKPHTPATIDAIKQRRMLSVSHLHPTEPERCTEELTALDVNETYAHTVMCLDSDLRSDPCWRDPGAPVVLNGILWGIMSSWRADDCTKHPESNYVTLVAAREVRSWIHSTTHGHKWNSSVDDASARDELEEDSSRDEDNVV